MEQLNAAAWNARYQSQDTPWDLGTPTPEFVRLLQSGILPKRGKAIVPGAGAGHDALLLAEAGLETDVVEIAPLALEKMSEEAFRRKLTVHAFLVNFFELTQRPYHLDAYDLMLEYTFFCAIDPSLRKDYVTVAAAVLKRGALFAGLFFPLSTDKAGPPFQVSKEEIHELFSPQFECTFSTPENSVTPRAGREILGLFRKK